MNLSFKTENVIPALCVVLFLLAFAGSQWLVYHSRGDADVGTPWAVLCGDSKAWSASSPCPDKISR